MYEEYKGFPIYVEEIERTYKNSGRKWTQTFYYAYTDNGVLREQRLKLLKSAITRYINSK